MSKVDIKFNNPILDQENIEKLANAINDTNEPETIVGLIAGQDISPDDISATGKITGAEIVENMSGYSFVPRTTGDEDIIKITPIYAGVVKNGNKLTFVNDFSFITNEAISAGAERSIGDFYLPSSIGEKLIPSLIGGVSLLEDKAVTMVPSSSYKTIVTVPIYTVKASDTRIYQAIVLPNLSSGAIYHCRIESTYLLSDNLVN